METGATPVLRGRSRPRQHSDCNLSCIKQSWKRVCEQNWNGFRTLDNGAGRWVGLLGLAHGGGSKCLHRGGGRG